MTFLDQGGRIIHGDAAPLATFYRMWRIGEQSTAKDVTVLLNKDFINSSVSCSIASYILSFVPRRIKYTRARKWLLRLESRAGPSEEGRQGRLGPPHFS